MRWTAFLCVIMLFPMVGEAKKKRRRRRVKPAWHTVKKPLPGPTSVFGSYAGGCIQGAQAVPETGIGYATIRRWRNRFYAHPTLKAYLADLGMLINTAGLPKLLIGDISQPRGGRMKRGHRSHQIGLDADIWFGHAKGDLKHDKNFPSLIVEGKERIDRKVFAAEHVQKLRIAAGDSRVERIFVNWVIKQELCAAEVNDRSWLRKIRPWYGHDRHFHVRLRCPADSPQCRPQRVIPSGDGCGTEKWFSWAARKARKAAEKLAKANAKPKPKNIMTVAQKLRRKARRADRKSCAQVLAAKIAKVAPQNKAAQ